MGMRKWPHRRLPLGRLMLVAGLFTGGPRGTPPGVPNESSSIPCPVEGCDELLEQKRGSRRWECDNGHRRTSKQLGRE